MYHQNRCRLLIDYKRRPYREGLINLDPLVQIDTWMNNHHLNHPSSQYFLMKGKNNQRTMWLYHRSIDLGSIRKYQRCRTCLCRICVCLLLRTTIWTSRGRRNQFYVGDRYGLLPVAEPARFKRSALRNALRFLRRGAIGFARAPLVLVPLVYPIAMAARGTHMIEVTLAVWSSTLITHCHWTTRVGSKRVLGC